MRADLESHLLQARGSASLAAGDRATARAHLQRAAEIAPQAGAPEKLFQLFLIQGERERAQAVLDEFGARVDSLSRSPWQHPELPARVDNLSRSRWQHPELSARVDNLSRSLWQHLELSA